MSELDEENSLTEKPAGTPMESRGNESRGGEMSFFDHLEELRSTVIWCACAFAAAGVLSLVFSKEIFDFLRWPLEHAAGVPADDQALMVMRFMDMFSILLYIALSGGFVFAGPAILYRVGKFVSPALSRAESVRLIPFCAVASVFFLVGAVIAFFLLAPMSISLPFWLAEDFGMKMNWLAEDYYLFIVLLTLFSGAMFELPLVVVGLIYFEIVEKQTLAKKWRWVLAGILVAVMLISPIGDPFALLVFSGAVFFLYLFSIYVGGILLRRKLARENARNARDDGGNGR